MLSTFKSFGLALALVLGALVCSPAHAFDLVYASGVGTCNGATPGPLDQVYGPAVTAPAGATENISVAFFSLTANASANYTTGWFPGTIKLSGGPANLDLENVTPMFVLQFPGWAVVYGQATYNGQQVIFSLSLYQAGGATTPAQFWLELDLPPSQNVNNYVQTKYIVGGFFNGTMITQ